MYPASFDYYRPKSVAEAAQLLTRHKEARLLAGGHSLLPVLRLRLAAPPALIDITGISDLKGIREEGGALRIGATTTYNSILTNDAVRRGCPVLAEAVSQIGDLQVRNCGTIGGSLAHADPAADLPTLMVALGATITAGTESAQRDIQAAEFFVDLFTTALKPGELLTAVKVPTYGRGTGAAYLKHPHPASRYAVVGVAAVLSVKDGKLEKAGVVIGGATPKPARASAAEAALNGQAATEATVRAAVRKVGESIKDPLGDTYASGEFRAHLATVLAGRALMSALERAKG